jgi:hypothetical protein
VLGSSESSSHCPGSHGYISAAMFFGHLAQLLMVSVTVWTKTADLALAAALLFCLFLARRHRMEAVLGHRFHGEVRKSRHLLGHPARIEASGRRPYCST